MECATVLRAPGRGQGRWATAVLAAILVLIGPRRPAGAEEQSAAATRQYAVAAGFQNHKLYKPAADEWRKFLAGFPKDPRCAKAEHYLGVCLLQDGQLDAAIAELTKLIATCPQYPELDAVYLDLGVAQFRRAGKYSRPAGYDAALQTFGTVLQKYGHGPQAPRAMFYQAETLDQTGKPAEAAAAYEKLVQADPHSELVPDALYALGLSRARCHQPERAAAAFAGFVQKFPNHPLAPECRVRQAEVLFGLKKFAAAERLFAQAAAAPGFAYGDFALLRQAGCRAERGQKVQAAALYQALPRKFPQSRYVGPALLAAGKCLYAAGRCRSARQALAPLVERKLPEAAEAAYWIGRCFIKEKNPAAAVPVFDAAIASKPQGPVLPLLTLGRADAIYEIPGRRAETVALYAGFARTFPADPQAPQALSMAAFAALGTGQIEAAKAHAAEFAARFPTHALMPEVLFVTAEAELRAGHYAAAADRYRDLVQKFPRGRHTEEAKVRRGLALYLQKQYDQAAAALAPELPTIKDKALLANADYVIGRARAAQRQFEPAIAALNAALAAKPDWAQADETLLALAHCYLSTARPAEAAAQLTRLTTAFPKSPVLDQAFYQLGECAFTQGQLDPALAHYREAAKRANHGPIAALAQFGIGRVLYRKDDWAGAVEALGAVAPKDPRSEVLPRARYVRALAEHKLKRHRQALDDVQAFLASRPAREERLDAELLLGLCQAALGQHEPAVRALRAVVTADPKYPRAAQVYSELGFALKALKRDREAADAFRRAAGAGAGPLAAESWFQLGAIRYAAADFTRAARAFDRAHAAAADPGLRELALHRLGWCAFKQGHFKTGAATFDRQAAEFSAGKLVHAGRFMAAECLFKQGQWRPAYDRYLKVIEAKPPAYHARALYRAGQCAGQLKDWPASAARYTELIAAFPKFERLADARYGLGWALQNQDRLRQAIAVYEQVTRETDTETAAKAQFMIGECYFILKDHAEAAKQFLKGAYGYPYEEWVGNCHFEAARCFEILKQVDQARQSYEVLVAKHPHHEKARLAADRLKELGG